METFKFIKSKYTNEKVVADSGVIKAVLSNGTDVTESVNDETFQTAALASGNVSDKEVKVYTLRESLSNINPIGEVTDNNTVSISSLGVTQSPSGVTLPQAAADGLSQTPATTNLHNVIDWNIGSGDNTTNVSVNVGKATVGKIAKFTISGDVSVKKFVKASGNLAGQTVFTKENLNTNGSDGTGYYSNGRKCVAIEKYTTENKVEKTPSNLNGGPYYNLVVNAEEGWKLGIDRDETIGTAIDGTALAHSFSINDISFEETLKTVRVSAWEKITDKGGSTSYRKTSEVIVQCDPNVYYQGYRLPNGKCFDNEGKELDSSSDLTSILTVYKEQRDVTFGGNLYKYDKEDKNIYYKYDSTEVVNSSSENCIISNDTLTPNQIHFNKEGDENSIYLNEKVENVQKKVEFQKSMI